MSRQIFANYYFDKKQLIENDIKHDISKNIDQAKYSGDYVKALDNLISGVKDILDYHEVPVSEESIDQEVRNFVRDLIFRHIKSVSKDPSAPAVFQEPQ